MALARITITLPRDLVAAADRRARQLDRSRSWVVAEALRAWIGPRVSEPAPPAYAPQDVAQARRQHLTADLALSPAERLRRADELVQLAWKVHGRGGRRQVIGFDTYEDFYEWKKARRAGA